MTACWAKHPWRLSDSTDIETIEGKMSTREVRLLHIVGDSKWGGGGVVILRLAVMATRLGWRVDVLSTDPTFQDALRDHGIGVVDLDVIRRDISAARDLRGLYRLYGFLRAGNYDLVHTHTSKAGFVGRIAAKLAGVRAIVHTVHGFAFHEESHPLALKGYALLERFASYFCHRIVTVSEFHRRWALQLGIGSRWKVVAIPNGIPEERAMQTCDPLEMRRTLGIQPEQVAILSTGRLAPQKGLEYLLAAVPLLADKLGAGFKVLLAGEGPLKEELQRTVKEKGLGDRVVFLGFRTDIGNLLGASDVVVLPTLREGLSIALLEAMAAGKPIVTTAIGSNREATRNGEAALLIPPKSPAAIADAVAQVIANPPKAAQLAGSARNIYRTSYREAQMLDAYRGIYDELLSSTAVAVAETLTSSVQAQ